MKPARYWAAFIVCGRCGTRHYSTLDVEYASHRRFATAEGGFREVTDPATVARMEAMFAALGRAA